MMGMSSLPLAVSVSRKTVERAGLTPMANTAFGGTMVVVAPVSTTRRTSRLPLGPVSRAYTIRRPASARRGYSGTEGDRVAVGQRLIRVEDQRQTLGFDQPVVHLIPGRRVRQQAPAEGTLGLGVQAVHRDQQPLATESLSDYVNRLAFHDIDSVAWWKPFRKD